MPRSRTSNIEPRAASNARLTKATHGGRRPGAGAPKGNLNALKHGLRSAQFMRFVERLARDPVAQAFFLQSNPNRPRNGSRPTQSDAVRAAAALLRHARGADVPALQAALRPLSKRSIRQLAQELAGQAIKKNSSRRIQKDRFYS